MLAVTGRRTAANTLRPWDDAGDHLFRAIINKRPKQTSKRRRRNATLVRRRSRLTVPSLGET
jgi:hypothetical protein